MTIKYPKNLSGVFFRYKNPETNKFENWCFEDLPVEEQRKILENRTVEWLRSLIHQMWRTLNLMCQNNQIFKEILKIFEEDAQKILNLTDSKILKDKIIHIAQFITDFSEYCELEELPN